MAKLNQKLTQSVVRRHYARIRGLKKGEGICSKGVHFQELTVCVCVCEREREREREGMA